MRILVVPVLLAISFTLSGCSAFLAASGREAPDLSSLSYGSARAQVDAALGRPISVVRHNWGELATYQYFTGDPPNYRRAAVNAVLAGLTLGVSELVTSPMEFVQGDRHVVTVRFDRRGNLLDSKTQSFDAPLEAPEKIIGLEETLAAEVPEAELIKLPVPNERARRNSARKL